MDSIYKIHKLIDFITDIVKKPCAVAGNSLGGFTALYAAASIENKDQTLINGVALLNAAGRFKNPDDELILKEEVPQWRQNIAAFIQRFIIRLSFIITKQPLRIEQVLKQVYPINQDNVDDELVESIQFPAQDPNAAEVFYRVVSKNGNGPSIYVDDLLNDLIDFNKKKGRVLPLLLLWGESDPWIRPAAADKIQAIYPDSKRVSINAGHCPMDEAPHEVNQALNNFLQIVHS